MRIVVLLFIGFTLPQDWQPFHNQELDRFKNFEINYEEVDQRVKNSNVTYSNRDFLSHEVIGYLPYWEYDEYPDLDYSLLTQINYQYLDV